MSEVTTLPQELASELAKPLPPEAISPHPTKPYLSTIKVPFVIERLNNVFGIGGWHVANDVVESGQMVVVKSTFQAPKYNVVIEQFGGNDNPDRGDAYKGACTDALSKIGSYLGVGMDVYKGIRDAGQAVVDKEVARQKREHEQSRVLSQAVRTAKEIAKPVNPNIKSPTILPDSIFVVKLEDVDEKRIQVFYTTHGNEHRQLKATVWKTGNRGENTALIRAIKASEQHWITYKGKSEQKGKYLNTTIYEVLTIDGRPADEFFRELEQLNNLKIQGNEHPQFEVQDQDIPF